MRSYELAFIIHPEAAEEGVDAVQEHVSQLVTSTGGEVTSVERWGLRRLAYPIQKQREGFYMAMQLQLQPQTIVDLERGLKLTEEVMRYLLVKSEA